MNYKEEKKVSKQYKQEYIDGLLKILKERQAKAEEKRNIYFKDIFTEQERYRQEFKQMLGWPLVDHTDNSLPNVSMEKLSDEDGYAIYRMQIEILDGLKMTGLFFKADGAEKKPLFIVQHGGWGTPEHIAGIYGYTTNYNDMLHRVRQNDVHVFAPQLLIWRDSYGVEFDRLNLDAHLKRVGSSITAIEIYGIMRILDYFETQDYVSDFGMVGLSYGGFYTLYTAAVDTRIKAAVSCSFFNKRDVGNSSDFVWTDSAEKFDDAEVACLIYPRKLCIEIGNKDTLFNYVYSKESFEKLKRICNNVGTEWVEFIVFDGDHEFCRDDEPIKRAVEYLK